MTSTSTRRSWVARALVFGVCVVGGLLISVNALSSTRTRQPADVTELIKQRGARVDELESSIAALSSEISSLSSPAPGAETSPSGSPTQGTGSSAGLSVAVGTVAVRGSGVRVQLDDASAPDIIPHGYDVNDYVVHQQDLEGVIAALWSGGAEAMTIQGQRVTMTTAVRCVGNVLLLQGRTYSPPYTIEAIGHQDGMLDALDRSPSVGIYRQYVQALGLGWSAGPVDQLDLPAAEGSAELRYAKAEGEG